MTAELFNSLEILKEWIIKNEVSLSTSKWANGLEIIEIEQLRFSIHPLSEEELTAIKVLTNNLLPQAYYHFLAEIGSGQFFINDYFPGFKIYNLAELKEYNQLIQQEIKEAGETIIDDYLMIGTHCSMGDWMGFCTTRKKEKNYDVFCHEYPIEEYAATSDELKSWRTFEDWIIKAIQTKGTETL